MAFIWQIGLYGKKYGKILKIWHLPYIYGNLAALIQALNSTPLDELTEHAAHIQNK
jgi:hypothetical protein